MGIVRNKPIGVLKVKMDALQWKEHLFTGYDDIA
jgi:hypothetical protein